MSLDVTEVEVEQATRGELDGSKFIEIIRRSLPFAYDTVERLAKGLADGAPVVLDQPVHMDDGHRNQLLRVFASTSIREALEQHFGIAQLAFQNCHAAGAATPEGKKSRKWREFTSPRGQVLAQHPNLRDC